LLFRLKADNLLESNLSIGHLHRLLVKLSQLFYTISENKHEHKTKIMKLGAFSVSLNVKDINASKSFYEKLGFTVFGGDIKMNYLIMKNENSLIGLFQDMFDNNILTFNPGWNESAQTIQKFDDVREIQKQLKSKNIELVTEADEKTSGPASIMMTDPDGNVILIDQHV
jgi:catechol-2,3-dioxygenase